jgi:hypothetical protein
MANAPRFPGRNGIKAVNRLMQARAPVRTGRAPSGG